MNILTISANLGYDDSALAKKAGVGFGDSNKLLAYTRQRSRLGVFLCLAYEFMAVCVGRPKGLPSSSNLGSPTPRTLPPQFGDFGGNGCKSLLLESHMTKNINGQSRPQFTQDQSNLVDSVAISLEKLEGIFGLISIAELDDAYLDRRLQSVLQTADEILNKAKSEFSHLILGGDDE